MEECNQRIKCNDFKLKLGMKVYIQDWILKIIEVKLICQIQLMRHERNLSDSNRLELIVK